MYIHLIIYFKEIIIKCNKPINSFFLLTYSKKYITVKL